jgi:hypothetical protein
MENATTKNLILTCGMLLLLFESCKKDNNPDVSTYVQGHIYDAYTHEGVPNAKVELWVDFNSGSTNLQDYDAFLNSTFTDSTGFYKMEFKGRKTSIYGIYPIKNIYYDNGSVSNFRIGQTIVDYNFWPKSWIHFHIKNTTPFNNYDTLVFNASHLFIGMNVDTLFYDSIPANLPPNYTWIIKKNGNSSGNIWYPSVLPFDTIQFNIFY